MKNITKNFVEVYMLDMEGRYGWWKAFEGTYNEAIQAVKNAKYEGARLVEKTFNPDNFTITERTVKETERVYNGLWWTGEVREK